MGQEQRMKRRQRKKKIRFTLFGLVLIYIFFRSVPSLFAIGLKTELPERYKAKDIIETEGIIIKEEIVFTADGEGEIKLIAKEGERVPVGAKVAELALIGDTSQLKERLEEIENKIEVLSKTKGENSFNNSYESNVNEIIKEIQNSISQGKYGLANKLKDRLSSYSKKEADIYNNTLIGSSLEALEKEKSKIENQISNSFIDYCSTKAGIVSYKIDGYEDKYSINNLAKYNYSDFKNIENKQTVISHGASVKVRQPIFKIINNFEWYILIKIDNLKDIDSFKEGNPILLSGKDIIGELRGYIERIGVEGNKGILFCRFNRDFYNYYDKRHIQLDIIKNEYDTFKIKKRCIIEKDGMKGVYIKDISGIVKFRPIEIVSEDDEYAYISTGDKNSYITIGEGDEKFRTVRLFDEILLNPANVEEGMIID